MAHGDEGEGGFESLGVSSWERVQANGGFLYGFGCSVRVAGRPGHVRSLETEPGDRAGVGQTRGRTKVLEMAESERSRRARSRANTRPGLRPFHNRMELRVPVLVIVCLAALDRWFVRELGAQEIHRLNERAI